MPSAVEVAGAAVEGPGMVLAAEHLVSAAEVAGQTVCQSHPVAPDGAAKLYQETPAAGQFVTPPVAAGAAIEPGVPSPDAPQGQPPIAAGPPTAVVPPVAGEPPIAAVPPVAGQAPVAAVPPVTTQVLAGSLPPVDEIAIAAGGEIEGTGQLAPAGQPPAAVATASAEVSVPSPRQPLSQDLEEEFAQALAGQSVEQLIADSAVSIRRGALEPQSQHSGRVVAVGREDVFVELGGREQGSLPLRLFEQPPEPGSSIEVVVERFNAEDGLYVLSLPQKPVEVDDWGDLREGMLVEARVTAYNSGGLECRVNNLRAFIPASQVALYRVEDLQQYVGQTLTCVVTEANRQRRNLVLSHRAVLERQREEAREQLLASLQPGQIREGTVRRLTDFGAFVDLGGVDGLLHVSQLAWFRVQHPSEVLSEGQRIQVRIEKVDPVTKKISLTYRDLQENPWAQAATKYPPQSVVRGKVTKLMDYGAFVELERGIEGLVHISELSHKRVWRVSDVVKEGDEVEALVLSVDPQAQRISLSLRALAPLPQPSKTEAAAEQAEQAEGPQQPTAQSEQPAPPPKRKPPKPKPEKPLLGGLDRPAKGHGFGLKW